MDTRKRCPGSDASAPDFAGGYGRHSVLYFGSDRRPRDAHRPQHPSEGLFKRRLALDLLHTAPAARAVLEPIRHLDFPDRLRHVRWRNRNRDMALQHERAIPAERFAISFPIQRNDEMASLRRPSVR